MTTKKKLIKFLTRSITRMRLNDVKLQTIEKWSRNKSQTAFQMMKSNVWWGS